MLFAWQGFRFEHPEDWAPVALTGNRREGYARLDGGNRVAFQVRWRTMRRPKDLRPSLDAYLNRLERDAKKAKHAFRAEIEPESDRLGYRWTGVGQGRGTLFYSEPCGRVFFLEAVGGRKDSLLNSVRALVESFAAEPQPLEHWALFGMTVRLPSGLLVARKEFRAGHTKLIFRTGVTQIDVERWGFGAELEAKHGLEPWARAALRMPSAAARLEEPGLVLERALPVGFVEARVLREPERNQLVTVKVRAMGRRWRPQWDWLA